MEVDPQVPPYGFPRSVTCISRARITMRGAGNDGLYHQDKIMNPAAKSPIAGPNADMDAQLRSMRIIHRIFCVVAVTYVLLAEKLTSPNGTLSAAIPLSLGILAFIDVMIAYRFRRKPLASAIKDLQRNSGNAQAVVRWRQAQMVIMVLLLSLALEGLTLRVMGASLLVAFPFYLTSIVLLLIWRPQEIVTKADATAADSPVN